LKKKQDDADREQNSHSQSGDFTSLWLFLFVHSDLFLDKNCFLH
jgi:hypothetical protein